VASGIRAPPAWPTPGLGTESLDWPGSWSAF